MKCLLMPQPWSPMHASMPVTFLVETPPKAPPGTRRPRKPPRVIPSPPPPTPQCAGGCKEYSRRGTNATVERFTCVDCGFVTTRSKGATEDPAMCPHVETGPILRPRAPTLGTPPCHRNTQHNPLISSPLLFPSLSPLPSLVPLFPSPLPLQANERETHVNFARVRAYI